MAKLTQEEMEAHCDQCVEAFVRDSVEEGQSTDFVQWKDLFNNFQKVYKISKGKQRFYNGVTRVLKTDLVARHRYYIDNGKRCEATSVFVGHKRKIID